VAVNLSDCPPFGSAHGRVLAEEEATAWQTAFDAGKASLDAGRYTKAVQNFTEALRIDPDHAEANYLAAVSAEKSGDATKAAQLYSRARDLDTLRVRTDNRMNALIRSVAAKRGTKFIECDEVFGASPGAESFVDHVHFTLEGVSLLANAVADAIDNNCAPLEGEALAERLDYNDWSRSKLATIMLQRLENPPFVEQAGNREQVERWRTQRETLRSSSGSPEAESILTDLGKHQDAYPWDSDYAVQSLHRLAGVGAWEEAAQLADEIRPKLYGSSPVNGLAALVYAKVGRSEDAAAVLAMGGPPFGYFLTDAAFQLFNALTQMGERSTAITVANYVLAQAADFPGRTAIVRWRDQAAR
jgi:tetratricopeptide (TPR) repeat protein